MTLTTTPEVVEPNELRAYDGFDFTTIVAGGAANGQDCLRLNHATDSNRQNLWQPNRTDTFLQPPSTARPALSFWICRRQAFAGGATGWVEGYTTTVVPGAASGGMIFGVANAVADSLLDSASGFSWGVFGTSTDDLYLAIQYRLSGNNFAWLTLKLADLVLDQWTFIVFNRGQQNPFSTGPADRNMQIYRNGRLITTFTPSYSGSGGGTYPLFPQFVDATTRFSIGDPTFGQTALRGAGDGPLCDLSQIAFHEDSLSQSEVLQLYESMLYGG